MRLVPVVSSMLIALGWEPAGDEVGSDGFMIAQFSETSFYRYEEVPASYAARVIFAESVGKAFTQYIKNGNFAYRKVSVEEVFS